MSSKMKNTHSFFGFSQSENPGHSQSALGARQLKFAMTGTEFIDINIPHQMDDQTLSSAFQVDRYVESISERYVMETTDSKILH